MCGGGGQNSLLALKVITELEAAKLRGEKGVGKRERTAKGSPHGGS